MKACLISFGHKNNLHIIAMIFTHLERVVLYLLHNYFTFIADYPCIKTVLIFEALQATAQESVLYKFAAVQTRIFCSFIKLVYGLRHGIFNFPGAPRHVNNGNNGRAHSFFSVSKPNIYRIYARKPFLNQWPVAAHGALSERGYIFPTENGML